MPSGLGTLFAILAGYLAVAAGALFVVWRTTRGLGSTTLRVSVRALATAFLLAPGAVACGGAAIVPFALVVVTDVVGLMSPNGCGLNTPISLASFLPAAAIVGVVLYVLERRRRAEARP